MNDWEKWREMVKDIRAGGMTWWWYVLLLIDIIMVMVYNIWMGRSMELELSRVV